MKPPTPKQAYERFLNSFGPQGWWPVTKPGATRPSYGHKGVLGERALAEISIGAILTQNTAWSNVERALEALNREGVRDFATLARTPSRSLQRLIRSSGYFRQKAKKLKLFARHALKRGRLSRWLAGELGPLRAELLGLWGVGPETADSILLYAGARPVFVIDAYTMRIGRRVGWFKHATYLEAQAFFQQRLTRRVKLYQEFHALLVVAAKRHCRSIPHCVGCPLNDGCRHAQGSRGAASHSNRARR